MLFFILINVTIYYLLYYFNINISFRIERRDGGNGNYGEGEGEGEGEGNFNVFLWREMDFFSFFNLFLPLNILD